MANTHSAQKRHRQSLKRRSRNAAVKTSVKGAIKKAREAILSGDKKKAEEALKLATAALDAAASKGVLHARNAARRVGRLAHMAQSKLAK